MKQRVYFYFEGNEIGYVERADDGKLQVSGEGEDISWAIETPIIIGDDVIKPEDDRFLESLPIAYSGSYFRAEFRK